MNAVSGNTPTLASSEPTANYPHPGGNLEPLPAAQGMLFFLMESPADFQTDAGPGLGRTDPTLFPSLGRLIRGLSAVFWGLPLVLVTAVQSAKAEPARGVHLWTSVAGFALVLYGIQQIGSFHPRERIWQWAVDRARIAALIDLGLSPFVYWWSRHPSEVTFQVGIDLLVISFLIFLIELSPLLDRLVAMLPDEALRQETRFFTRVSRFLLSPVLAITLFYFTLLRVEPSFPFITPWLSFMAESGFWLVLFLVLVPIATLMALIWKIKELIFHSVFGR